MRARRVATAVAITAGLLGLTGVASTPSGAAPVQAVPEPPAGAPTLVEIGRYTTGLGEASAEIVAYDDGRFFVVNSDDTSVDVVELGADGATTLVRRIDLSAFGDGVTSVDVQDGLIAVAVVAPVPTDPGSVVFVDDETFAVRVVAPVGALPDMLSFTPDGTRVLVANEGQPSDDYTVDPEGSVSIIRLTTLLRRGGQAPGAVTTAHFRTYDRPVARGGREVPDGVRVFGPGASPSQDFEPEYITVSPDSATAYVSLQENNALAVIDVVGGRVDDVRALGTKDHSVEGNGLDPSDRDGGINIGPWPVQGLFMPDGIASYEAGGELFVVTANEGDARDYDGFAEEARVGDDEYVLDPTVFPNAAELEADDQLGRLTVTTATGDTDGDGDFDEIHAYGARSFSIFSASGELVFDSGDDFEQITAELEPDFFHSNNDENTFDNRSDNKGPEPESVEIGVIDGRTYAYVGLERVGGVMVYDITDPAAPIFVEWSRTRVFEGETVGPDSGPEGIEFVAAADSPTGLALLLVANEITGTVTILEARPAEVVDPEPASTLTLLHNNDGGSSLQPIINSRPRGVTAGPATVATGGIAAFATVTNREIADARSLGNSVVNVYAGDAFLASATLQCAFEPDGRVLDAVAQRMLPYDAHVFGNHEFDYGPEFLARFIRTFTNIGVDQPFLSANLDFSGEPSLAALEDDDGLIDERVGEPEPGEVIARSMVVVDEVTGEQFGIVGATTPDLPSVSSPGGVTVAPDLEATAVAVQAELDRLQAEGINKLILVSHLQSIDNDEALIALLDDVDVAVAGVVATSSWPTTRASCCPTSPRPSPGNTPAR
ncbi:MAG: choice-of-anchor I family protein [Acidimicrobiia bacterium]|nr:choice-of-anchor I family protein [Acidimicrobiia bacterium]